MNPLQIIILILALIIALLGALIFFDIIPAPRTIFGFKYTTTKEEITTNTPGMSIYQKLQLREKRQYKYIQYRGDYLKNCQKIDENGEYNENSDDIYGMEANDYYEEENTIENENVNPQTLYDSVMRSVSGAVSSGQANGMNQNFNPSTFYDSIMTSGPGELSSAQDNHEQHVEDYEDVIRDLSNRQLDEVTGYVDNVPEANSEQCLSMGDPALTPLCQKNPVKTTSCDSGCGTYVNGVGYVCCTSKCCPNLGVSCANANDSYCADKNRESCSTGIVPNTCGPCLPDFYGDEGPSNNACIRGDYRDQFDEN
tara:strand:- start:1179 stop:2111 length:933 start_codon:yes stop_codon:yes gene_type:complete